MQHQFRVLSILIIDLPLLLLNCPYKKKTAEGDRTVRTTGSDGQYLYLQDTDTRYVTYG